MPLCIGRPCLALMSGWTHPLRSPQSDTCDAWNVLQAQFSNRLPCFLFISAVDSNGRTGWDIRFAFTGRFWFRVRRAGGILRRGSRRLRGRLVIRELFYSRVCHSDKLFWLMLPTIVVSIVTSWVWTTVVIH